MTDKRGEIRPFPGVTDVGRTAEAQPQADVIEFLTDLLARAERGEVQGVAVATVHPGHNTADGWRLGATSTATMHDLMASVTYLHNRMADSANKRDAVGFPSKG